jgi:MFS family permease
LAGFDAHKSQWISGLNNIFYLFSTLICVFTLDRIGRRKTLFWGAIGQGIAMFLAGGFSRLGLNASDSGSSSASGYGIAAASMIFLFTFVFGATWLTVPWLYPAEIFPLAVRAKGNAWGVVGWSIGNGWLVSDPRNVHRIRLTLTIQTLLLPVCFQHIGEKTYYLFGIANAIAISIVWAFYPESNQRTLEEMDLLFADPTPWNWRAEANFARLSQEHPELARHNARASVEDIERPMTEKPSVAIKE